MKKTFTLFFVLVTIIRLEAQADRSSDDIPLLQFGFKAGAVYTNISDLSKVLVSESYYTGYTFENSNQWGLTGGVYINYKFEGSISALYSELSYSRLGNKLHYSDVNDLEYDFIIQYDYVNLEAMYKAYVIGGMHFGIGPKMGINLTPGGLQYTSNGEDLFGPDIRIQQQMQDVLKGRYNFSLGVSAGYEFTFGLSIDARFYYGLSDVMETLVNNFNFIENNNTSQIVQVTLGYAIPYELGVF
jgi:hypothetical protein